MAYARENKPLPEGWVLDPEGNTTTDANIGLAGTMVPFFGIGLFVEIMAITHSGEKGGPPKTGQCSTTPRIPKSDRFIADQIPGDHLLIGNLPKKIIAKYKTRGT